MVRETAMDATVKSPLSRIAYFMLACILAVSLTPVTAFAADGDTAADQGTQQAETAGAESSDESAVDNDAAASDETLATEAEVSSDAATSEPAAEVIAPNAVSSASDASASNKTGASIAAEASSAASASADSGISPQALTDSFAIATTGGTAWGAVSAGASDTIDYTDTIEYKITASFSGTNTSKNRSITINVPAGMDIVSASAPAGSTLPADITPTILTDLVSSQIASVNVTLDPPDVSAYAAAPVNNVPEGSWYYKNGTIQYTFNDTADEVVLYVKVKPNSYLYNSYYNAPLRADTSPDSTATTGVAQNRMLDATFVSGSETKQLEKTESLTQSIATNYVPWWDMKNSGVSDAGVQLYAKTGETVGYMDKKGFARRTSASMVAMKQFVDKLVFTCPYPSGVTYAEDKGVYPDGVVPDISVTGDITTGGMVTYTFTNVYIDENAAQYLVAPQFTISADYYETGKPGNANPTPTNKSGEVRFNGTSCYAKVMGEDAFLYSQTSRVANQWAVTIIDEESIQPLGTTHSVGNYNDAGDFTGTDWLGYIGYKQQGASVMPNIPYTVEFGTGLGVKAMKVPVPTDESLDNITITTTKGRTLTIATLASEGDVMGAPLNRGNSLGLADDEYIAKIEGTISNITPSYLTNPGPTNAPGYFSGVIVDPAGDLTAKETVGDKSATSTTKVAPENLNLRSTTGTTSDTTGDAADVFYPGSTVKVSGEYQTFGWASASSSTIVDPNLFILVPADTLLDPASVKVEIGSDDSYTEWADVTSAAAWTQTDNVTIGSETYTVYKLAYGNMDCVAQSGTMASDERFRGARLKLSYDLHVSYSHAGGKNYKLSDLVFMDTHTAVGSLYAPTSIVDDPGINSGATNKLVALSGSFTVQPLPELRVIPGIKAQGDPGPYYTYDDTLPDATTAQVNAGKNADIQVNWINGAPTEYAQFNIYMNVPAQNTGMKYYNNKVTTDVYNQPEQIDAPGWTGMLAGPITAPGFTVYYSTTGSEQTAPHLDGDNTWEPVAGANWQTTVADWSAVKFVKYVYTDNGGVVAKEAQGTFTFPMMVDQDSADNDEVDYFRFYFGQAVGATDVQTFLYSSVLAAKVELGRVSAKDAVSKTGGDAFTEDQIKLFNHVTAVDHEGTPVPSTDITVDADSLAALNAAKTAGELGVFPVTYSYTDPYIGKPVTVTVNVTLTDNGTDGTTLGEDDPVLGANNKTFDTGGSGWSAEEIGGVVDLLCFDKNGDPMTDAMTVDQTELDALNAAKEAHQTGVFPVTFTDPDGNTVTSYITLVGKPELAVTITADKEEVLPGEEVHFTIDVTNSGNIASDEGKVTFPIPTGMEVVDLAGGTLSADGKSIIYSFDPITWDGSMKFNPVLKVPADAKIGTTIQAQCYISELGGVALSPAERIMSNTAELKVIDKITPLETAKRAGTSSAKTGDTTPLTGAALVALAATGVLLYSRRRKGSEE